jgi:hypothetical protein
MKSAAALDAKSDATSQTLGVPRNSCAARAATTSARMTRMTRVMASVAYRRKSRVRFLHGLVSIP